MALKIPSKKKKKKKLSARARRKRVLSRRHARWVQRVEAVIRRIRKAKREFTTDDLWPRIPAINEPRVLGAAIIHARDKGLIVATWNFRVSKRPECHQRPLRVWKRRR